MEDGLPGEQEVSQKALLQEELVTLRARICDLSSVQYCVCVCVCVQGKYGCEFRSEARPCVHSHASSLWSTCFQLWAWETLACIWEHKITKYYRPTNKQKIIIIAFSAQVCAYCQALHIFIFAREKCWLLMQQWLYNSVLLSVCYIGLFFIYYSQYVDLFFKICRYIINMHHFIHVINAWIRPTQAMPLFFRRWTVCGVITNGWRASCLFSILISNTSFTSERHR